MLFPVTPLTILGVIMLAGSTKGGDVMSLQKLVVRSLFSNHYKSTCDFIMETEITHENAEVIHLLLKNAGVSCVERYNNMKEGPERLAQLLEPRLLKDERYQESLYSLTKLLVNPDLARAFFGPGEDKGSQGKGKEKVRDGEPLKSVEHSDDEVKAEIIDDLPRIMGGLKLSEQPSKGIESIQYGGNFFEVRHLPELLVELYKVDRELAMCIVEFIIKHQMDYMNSRIWLKFLRIASLEDQLSVVSMLAPHEMSFRILNFIGCDSGPNSKELVSRYLDEKLPENELLVRCAIAREAEVVVDDLCSNLLRKTTNEGLMDILEGREDRSSRMALSGMVLRLKLKSEADVISKAVFYKLTPYDTELLARFCKLSSTQKAALKSDVPLYLWPAEYQPLDCRLKRWLTFDGPYGYVEETDIPREQFDSAKPHFALNTYTTTVTEGRIRVADYFIERAKGLLASPMWIVSKDNFKLMLIALGYLLAEGRQLDCSNFFVDIGDDSSWHYFIENFNKRIRKRRYVRLRKDPVCIFVLSKLISGVWRIISLQEFRSLVDSSYRGQMSE
jgi:hypothetical protein